MRLNGSLARVSLLLLAIVILTSACTRSTPTPTPTATPGTPAAAKYPRPELLVETQWLSEHLNDAGLRIIDVRSDLRYKEGHIPGAVNLNPAELDTNQPVRGMVKPPQQAAEILGRAGISDDSQVVIYDGPLGLWGARLFWVLEYYGHQKVSLLSGNFPKWQDEKRPVNREEVKVSAATFTPQPQPSALATKEYILENTVALSLVLIDVRTSQEYSGDESRSTGSGHIPGALNLPWESTLITTAIPEFLPLTALESLYFGLAPSKDQEVIVYCQTGVRAAHTYFVLRLMGYNKVRLYDGSWEEWGNDESLPTEF